MGGGGRDGPFEDPGCPVDAIAAGAAPLRLTIIWVASGRRGGSDRVLGGP